MLVVNNPAASVADARDPGSVPGLGRSSGEGNGNPLQYSCLENPMDRGAWWATVFGVAKESDTTEHLAAAAAAAARQALAGLPASSWGTFHSWGFHPRDLRPPPHHRSGPWAQTSQTHTLLPGSAPPGEGVLWEDTKVFAGVSANSFHLRQIMSEQPKPNSRTVLK